MKYDNNLEAFFELVRAGLWEQEARLSCFGVIDFYEVYRLAEEQTVIGLVAAGLEHVKDVNVPKENVFQFVEAALQLEQQNKAINAFVADIAGKMHAAEIRSLLVKGQGIAQNYSRPLWRTPGDVDLLLDTANYEKAKNFFAFISDSEETEVEYRQHKAYHVGLWEVELHGNLRGQYLNRVDKVIDAVQKNAFDKEQFRLWKNGNTDVYLPSVNDDVIFVFAHILQHFFIEGVGLRQICDWCRLVWVNRDLLDLKLLESRLISMRLMSEWKVFGALAVHWLGLPSDTMPFNSNNDKWKRKADRSLFFVMKTGNFGQNRKLGRTYKYHYIVRKCFSLLRHTWDMGRYLQIFPVDAVKVWAKRIRTGIRDTAKGN